MEFHFILGILFLVGVVWAIINIITSKVSTGTKFIWLVTILLVPVIGFIVWYFAGPRSQDAS